MPGFILSGVMPPLPFECTAETVCCLLTWCLSLSSCKCSSGSDQNMQRTYFTYPGVASTLNLPVLRTHKGPVPFSPSYPYS